MSKPTDPLPELKSPGPNATRTIDKSDGVTFAESANEVRYLKYLQQLCKQIKVENCQQNAAGYYQAVSDHIIKQEREIEKLRAALQHESSQKKQVTQTGDQLRRNLASLEVQISGEISPSEFLKKQKQQLADYEQIISRLEMQNKQLTEQLKSFDVFQGVDYQKLALMFRQEKMLNKTRNEQQAKQIQVFRQRIKALEAQVPGGAKHGNDE